MLQKKALVIFAAAFTALATSTPNAFADNDKGDYQWGHGHHTYKKHHHHDRKISVDCDDGQTLTEALEIARAGTTIHVEGTCNELVTVTTDSLTLDGGGTAIIDGGGGGPLATAAITIDGARNITITGFIVQHSPGAGIWGQRASTFVVRDIIARENALTGIGVVENSAAEIADCNVTGGTSGIGVGSSHAILSGEIGANSTSVFGVAAFDNSTIEFRGVTLTANDNRFFGLWSIDSAFSVPSLAGLEPTVIEANYNGLDGIRLTDHASLRTNNAAKITASNNVSSGIWVGNQGIIANGPPVPVEYFFENNPVGMNFQVGSGAAINGGKLTVSGNDIGVLAEGADLIIENANITGNYKENESSDVILSLGTRAVFDNVNIGSIDCDDSVVSRGACDQLD